MHPISPALPRRSLLVAGSLGSTNDSSVATGTDVVHTPNLTLPARYLTKGKALEVMAHIEITSGAANSGYNFKLKLGGTTIVQIGATAQGVGANLTKVSAIHVFRLSVADDPSAAARIVASVTTQANWPAGTNTSNVTAQPVTIDTTQALVLGFASNWAAAGTGPNTITLQQLHIEALN